jgi:hypothetical protein
MDIYQVIHHNYMPYESNTNDVLFIADSLELAIDFAKKSVRTYVIGQQRDNWSFRNYFNFNMVTYNLFNSRKPSYNDNCDDVFVIKVEMNKPTPQKYDVVWKIDSEFVFQLFSEDLDTCFRNDVVPTLTVDEKLELFISFKKDISFFSVPSKKYSHINIKAADILALTSANKNDEYLYNTYEMVA